MNRAMRTRTFSYLVIVASFSLPAFIHAQPSAATPPGPGPSAAVAGDVATGGRVDLPSTGIETTGNIIIDHRNSSITIKATPSQHREIEKLLEILTQDPLASKDVR